MSQSHALVGLCGSTAAFCYTRYADSSSATTVLFFKHLRVSLVCFIPCNLCTVFNTDCNGFKNRIPMRLRSNIVYKFTCQRCFALYLGETTLNLHTKICKYMGISAHTGNETSYSTSLSNILTHKRETGHPISFDNFSVLANGRSESDTLIRERLLIAKINPSLNVNIRSSSLMLFWDIYFPYLSLTPVRHVINLFLIHVYFCNRVGY